MTATAGAKMKSPANLAKILFYSRVEHKRLIACLTSNMTLATPIRGKREPS